MCLRQREGVLNPPRRVLAVFLPARLLLPVPCALLCAETRAAAAELSARASASRKLRAGRAGDAPSATWGRRRSRSLHELGRTGHLPAVTRNKKEHKGLGRVDGAAGGVSYQELRWLWL